MKKKKSQIENEDLDGQLREKALGILAQFPVVPGEMQGKTPEEVIHELQVHQIELEMQNEELRRAQLALEESRQRYSDLYHFAPVGYFTFTPEGLIKEVNLTGAALLGLNRQKLIKARFRRIVTAKDQDLWDRHFLSVLREGEKQTCDLMLKNLDGPTFYAGLESIRMEVSRGEFQVHTTVTDITERKRLEEVIRQSEERYRTAVIEEIEEGYYEVDLAGNFTFVNDSMIRHLQYSREELIGMNYRTYIPREEVEGVYKTFNRVFRTGEIIKGYPVTNIRKDGTPIFFEDSISCRRNREGRIIGFRGICRDITERKQAETRLIESEEKYRSLASGEDSMYLVDKESRFRFLNEAHLSRLSISLDEVVGRSYGEFHSEEDTKQFTGIVKEVFETNTSLQVEHKSEREPKYFLRTFSPIRDPQGSVTAVTVISKDITERKRAEEALRESEKYFKEITENSSDMIIITDKNGDIKYCSRSVERFTGYKPEELIGRSGFTFIHPDDVERAVSDFGKAILTTDSPIPNAFRMVHKDGSERYCDGLGKNLLDNSAIAGFVMNIHDITERKRAEEELQRSENQYRVLTENSPDLIARFDRQLRHLYVNLAAAKAGWYSPEEYVGKNIREVGVPDHEAQKWEERLRAAFATGQIVEVEDKFDTPQGERYFSTKFVPDRASDGTIRSVQSVARDITERKRVEIEINRQREILQKVFDHIPVMITYFDETGDIKMVNQDLVRKLGWTFEEWKTENILAKSYPEPEAFKEALDFMISKPSGWKDFKTTTKYGTVIDTTWTNISLPNGVSIGIGQDITERKRAEKELRIYQKELQALAIKMTEVEETERKEIARTLHDLVGQNLTALNLNLNIILEMMTEDQKSLFSSRLEDSQKLLEETTQHIREVMYELRPSVLDDFGLIAALRWYGQRFNRMTGIQTNVEGKKISPRLPPSLETIIFRIAQEALTNVLKHASAGKVDLRLEKVEDRVQLTIMDDGRGFIFKGFRFGGEKRGWGLTMMRERAVALGGDLQIYSEPGKGTRIILQLPVEL